MASTGPFLKLRTFFGEVQSELLKCNWPTWAELRQSTVVVIACFLLLGAFVAVSDGVLAWLVRVIL